MKILLVVTLSLILSSCGTKKEDTRCGSSCQPTSSDNGTNLLDDMGQASFQNIFFQIPNKISNYGQDTNYDNRNVKFYEVPAELIDDKNLKRFSLIVYKSECSGSDIFIDELKADLASREIESIVISLDKSKLDAHRITWFENHPSMLLAFKSNTKEECAIVKISISGTSWEEAKNVTSVLTQIEKSLTLN